MIQIQDSKLFSMNIQVQMLPKSIQISFEN